MKLNRQRRSFADFQDTGWRTGLFRALLIVLVAASVLSAPLALLRTLTQWRLDYVLPVAVLAAALGVFNTVRLGRPDWRANRTTVFRLGEICLLVIAMRITTWMMVGWPTAAQVVAWLRHPRTFFDGEFIAVSLLTLIVWGLAVKMVGDFLDLAIQPDEAAARAARSWGDSQRQWQVFRPVARSEIVGRFAQRWVWAGVALITLAAMSRVVISEDSRGIVKFGLSGLGLPNDVLIGLLVYFLAGLLLLSDARLALLRGRWYNELVDMAGAVTRRWHLIGGLMVAGVAFIALLLPHGSSNWLAVALEWVLALVARLVFILMALFQLLIQLVIYLLRLLSGSGKPSEPLGSLAPTEPRIPTQAEMARRLPDWLGGGVLWLIVFLVAGYLLFVYLRANGGLSLAGFMKAARLVQLRLWWRARWARLDRVVQGAVAGLRMRRRTREPGARRGVVRSVRLADLLPRERVRYLYLLAVEQAAERGLHRPPSRTPLEFVQDLEAAWPDAQPDVQVLTEAFVAARYASRDIAAGEAQRVHGVWQRIMVILRRPGGGEHSRDRG